MYNKSLLQIGIIPVVVLNLVKKKQMTNKNINNERLYKLFNRLKKSSNVNESKKIEEKIHKIWTTHHYNIELTKKLEYGIEFFRKRDYEKALSIYKKIIIEDSRWAEAYNQKANVEIILGDFEKSLCSINKVLEIEPRHFDALDTKAIIYFSQNKFNLALKTYKKIITIYPNNEKALTQIGLINKLINNTK